MDSLPGGNVRLAASIPGLFLLISVLLTSVSGAMDLSSSAGLLCLTGSMSVILSESSLRRVMAWCAVGVQFVLAACFVASSMSGWSAPAWLWPFYFTVAAFLPAGIVLSAGLLSRCGDPVFLSSEIKGTDAIRGYSPYVLALLMFLSGAVVWMSLSLPPPFNSILSAASLLSLLAMVLILYIRLLVGLKRLALIEAEVILPPVSNSGGISLADKALFQKIERYLTEKKTYLRPDFSIDLLAREVCSNRSYISRCVNNCTGYSFPRYINSLRVKYAQEAFLADMDLMVTDLYQLSGFSTGVNFTIAFNLEVGENPRDWCKKQREKDVNEESEPPSSSPEEEIQP
ncbi:MAG: helix-turn-helix transcriptional regulator [Bacteroidales bacterium]|nr:helix-turn-helix transcriptional regulator [Bacteroidales bacterium]